MGEDLDSRETCKWGRLQISVMTLPSTASHTFFVSSRSPPSGSVSPLEGTSQSSESAFPP